MALTTAFLLLAALPESGAVTRARATAQIVAAEEIDFARPGGHSDGSEALFRQVTRSDEGATLGEEEALQLVEFQ